MLESKIKFPSSEMIHKLAVALGIDPTELFLKEIDTAIKMKNSKKAAFLDVGEAMGHFLSSFIDRQIQDLDTEDGEKGTVTDLRQLLAHNMKERRRVLNLTQTMLAERAGTSTYYIGMIEARKKYPSPEMMQKIAAGLEVDTPELFSVPISYPVDTIKKYQKEVLKLIKSVVDSVLDQKLKQLGKLK